MELQDKNENRDNTITLKVTNDEKELLQQMADETGLSLSDFIRRKAAANEKYFSQLINENSKLSEEIKDLRVKSSFGLPIHQPGSIVLNLSTDKIKLYELLFVEKHQSAIDVDDEYYIKPRPISERIVCALDGLILENRVEISDGKVIKRECMLIDGIRTHRINEELAINAYPNLRNFIHL